MVAFTSFLNVIGGSEKSAEQARRLFIFKQNGGYLYWLVELAPCGVNMNDVEVGHVQYFQPFFHLNVSLL